MKPVVRTRGWEPWLGTVVGIVVGNRGLEPWLGTVIGTRG